jgi:predicted small lipoprotein YifL
MNNNSRHCEERFLRRSNPAYETPGLPRSAKSAGLAMTFTVILFFLTPLLSACGQTGRLYLPHEQTHTYNTTN